MKNNSNQDHFLGGFTLGLFAGAVGYFLFATKEGKKVRTDIKKQMQDFKKGKCNKSKKNKHKDQSVWNLMDQFFNEFIQQFEIEQIKTKDVLSESNDKKTKKAKNKNLKFKNI